MTDPIELQVSDGIAVATLNRPDSYNALDLEAALAWQAIAHAVVDRDDVAALVIAARGRAFCAGGDLRAMSAGGGALVDEIARSLHDGIHTLVSSTLPVVAAVSGVVASGGLGLLLASDYAIAGETATFSARYAAMGLTPDMSVTALLGRAVGERRALQLVLDDRSLTAAEAREWGLVAEVVPAADVATRSVAVATAWVANGLAIGQTKRLIRAGHGRDLGSALDDERETIARLFDGEESRARVARFLDKPATRG